MKCLFCKDKPVVKAWDTKIQKHITSTLDRKGHFHIHGDIGNKELVEQFVEVIEREAGIEREVIIQPEPQEIHEITRVSESPSGGRHIVFGHHRALGDGLMFTAGIRDFKLLFPDIKVDVDSNQSALWQNNPYIEHTYKDYKDLYKEYKNEAGQDAKRRNEWLLDQGIEYYKVGYPMVGNANNTAMHFSVMFLFDMIAVADLHNELPISLGEFCAAFANGRVADPPLGEPNDEKHGRLAKEPFISLRSKYRQICKEFVRQRGDLHLTPEEKRTNIIQEVYGVEKYWVIAPGGKRDCTAKIWDWRNFQQVIDYFDGLIKFVVIGRSDHLIESLRNVIDLTDKFNKDVRGLIPLVYNADGCVSGPSFLMHLAAAMPPRINKERKPCVSILGGREPSAWTWYCNHQVLHTNGVFTCCDNGGCWKARTVPLPKDPKHNKSLCQLPIKTDGRTVQSCMESITVEDVIRAIEKYYDGDIYTYMKPQMKKIALPQVAEIAKVYEPTDEKEINLLGNLNSSGGGEQSLMMIATLLHRSGWKVNLYPWGSTHENYLQQDEVEIQPYPFRATEDMLRASDGRTDELMFNYMKPGLPLLFYGNDCVWDFAKYAQGIVDKSSSVAIGINFANGSLPVCRWLGRSGKLKAVIFQNEEKKSEWKQKAIGFEDTKLISLFGAIDLNKYYEVCTQPREKKEYMVILKHCKPDGRKYVTEESKSGGDKKHIWQKHFFKETDIKFYTRLMKDTKNTIFEFMEAHREIVNHFENKWWCNGCGKEMKIGESMAICCEGAHPIKRMIFHKWNAMDVGDFLARGHLYLYRASNHWRDNYPRVVAEALAAGLPVLSEPRDGTKDRIEHGDTGFYCCHYDEYLMNIKTMMRKEKLRQAIGREAKDWAKKNLDPMMWIDVLEDTLV